MSHYELLHGDCLELMRAMPSDSVDLVMCSPPYEAARTYGIDFNLKDEAWVAWALERFIECLRISRGLVAWVVEGQTRKFNYSASPILLAADLKRAGVKLRKPVIYKRYSIPGSGGPDWWRNDYEFVICAAKGRLPWSDNTATGKPPKCPPGGAPSHRKPDGRRYGEWPKSRKANGDREVRTYKPPKIANPGNIIDCGAVGGNNIGNRMAHENEAPYPERLAEAFVLSFCPPGGTVFDPFCGSGTTVSVAVRNGRNAFAVDIRESQVELARRRIADDLKKHESEMKGEALCS